MGLIDLDKVIKGLECCSSLDSNCADCPYDYDGEGGESPCLREKLMSDALKLLKEQEPIIPSVGGSNDPDGHSWWYQCGKCKMPIDYGDRFCRRCGRAVKWE